MAVEIANSGKQIRFYTIDTWQGSAEEAEQNADPDVQAGTLYEKFLENIAPVRNYVHPIRSLSADAASIFDDESVDFVFVDAGHTRQDVASDLKAWWPKLVAGGVIAGDDWDFEQSSGEFGVRRAVRGFFNRPSCFYHIKLREGYCDLHWTQWLVRKEGTTLSNLMAKLDEPPADREFSLTTSPRLTGSSP